MLPNRLNLYKATEDQLKAFKQQTGITPNVAARVAFAVSLDKGYIHTDDGTRPDGTLNLDRSTWFGEYITLYEALLVALYPEASSEKLERAWARHVEAGLPDLRNELL